MESKFTKYEAIKFPSLFVRALAKDFEDKDVTWTELYSSLFIKGTDVYREMRVTLTALGVNIKDKVSYDEVFKITKMQQVTFELEEEEHGRRILTHLGTKEQTIVPKKASINVVLAKMGYTQKVKKV